MCIFIVADLTKNVLKLVERTDMQSLTFLSPKACCQISVV